MVSLRDFYCGKRVFLTGHTGFKGTWLALWLTEMGASVHGYSLEPPTNPSLFVEGGLSSLLAGNVSGDIRDYAKLSGAMSAASPDIVFHLAAQALVRLSYRDPRLTYETNVMGTVNVLEAVRHTPSVRVCQVVTSDKCYENHEWIYPYRENDGMGGADPYSNSKGCAELVVSAYRRSFFPPAEVASHKVSISSARAGNVIGGGDWAQDRIVPDCVRALERGGSIPVRNPGAIRPWQHVLEPLSGYLLLASRQWDEPAILADAFNFGPNMIDNVSVRELVTMVVGAWGSGAWHSTAASGQKAQAAHEANYLKLDATKACAMLNWRPQYSVAEAVARTMEWYRHRSETGASFSARDACLKQIRQYAQRREAPAALSGTYPS